MSRLPQKCQQFLSHWAGFLLHGLSACPAGEIKRIVGRARLREPYAFRAQRKVAEALRQLARTSASRGVIAPPEIAS